MICQFCNAELSPSYESQGSYNVYKCSACVLNVHWRKRIRDNKIIYCSFKSIYNNKIYSWEYLPVVGEASLIYYKDETFKVCKFKNNIPNITPNNFIKILPTLLVFI